MPEIWDLYTLDRKKIGETHIRGNRLPVNAYHIVVEIWTIVGNRILLTQRHPDKPFGLLWECTGGSILTNENSVEGAVREVKEEIGLNVEESDLILIKSYSNEDSLYDVFVNYQDANCMDRIKLQPEEVINVQLVTHDEFKKLLDANKVIKKLEYVNELIEGGKISLQIASK